MSGLCTDLIVVEEVLLVAGAVVAEVLLPAPEGGEVFATRSQFFIVIFKFTYSTRFVAIYSFEFVLNYTSFSL